MTPATLFAAPLGYTPSSLEQWITDLEETWLAFSRTSPSDVRSDLQRMSRVFGAGTSARALRRHVGDLGRVDARVLRLPERVALPIGDRALITPEGRILLDVLLQLRRAGGEVVDQDAVVDALDLATRTRAEWYRDWMVKQLDGTLSPPALGAAVFLLVNGSVGREAALEMPDAEAADLALGAVALPMIGLFSERLGGDAPASDTGIRSHWAFTQVSRFLSRRVARETTAKGTALYVKDGHEQDLLADLRRRLAKYKAHQVGAAVDALVGAYRANRGKLVAAGVSHEEPVHTRRVVAALSPPVVSR